jgi:hypothetical protein
MTSLFEQLAEEAVILSKPARSFVRLLQLRSSLPSSSSLTLIGGLPFFDMDKTSASDFCGRVVIVSFQLDTWLLFISRALTRAGYDVTMITNRDASREDLDHRDILKYFLPNPFCRLIDLKDASQMPETRYDFAVAGLRGASSPEEKQKMLALTGATPLRAVVLRHYNSRFPSMARLVAKEMLHPFIRRSSRVLVERYANASWTLRLLSPPFRLGVIPHQRTICQGMPDGLLDQTERPYLFNFLGSHGGPRAPIIDRLESSLQISGGGAQQVNLGGKDVRVVWHADRPGSTRARPLNEYFDTLRHSFFTLCLPGCTVITHRVLEAIHCGSIPVLSKESAPEYLLPLEHGRNCLLVTNDDWASALGALSALDQKQVLEMQNAVKNLARNEASIPALEKKYLHLLGLNGA